MESRENAIRNVILRLAKKKFGLPSSKDMQKLHALLAAKDIQQLDELCDRLLTAPSWQAFLTQED